MALASVFQHASARHPPPDVTWDIWETQILSGAAVGCQGLSMEELLDAVFGSQDPSLCAKYLVYLFS